MAAQRMAGVGQAAVDAKTVSAQAAAAAPATAADIKWPHMVDNIFLGLAALLAAHWLATTLPAGNRAVFRFVGLVVALPFGFRFERNSRSSTAGQVLAALAFGSLGTLVIGMLDLATGAHGAPPPTAEDIAALLATIALSHYAGSALAQSRQARIERRTTETAATGPGYASAAGRVGSLMSIEPARIKSTAETVKAIYDAAAPMVAGAAALWAALGHIFS